MELFGILFLILLIWGLNKNNFTKPEKSNFDIEGNWFEREDEYTKLAKFIQTKKDYLSSQHWANKRNTVIKINGNTCKACGANGPLEVHHLSGYNQIPNEPITNLVPLCRSCHAYQHEIHGFPESYEGYMHWNVPLEVKNNRHQNI